MYTRLNVQIQCIPHISTYIHILNCTIMWDIIVYDIKLLCMLMQHVIFLTQACPPTPQNLTIFIVILILHIYYLLLIIYY